MNRSIFREVVFIFMFVMFSVLIVETPVGPAGNHTNQVQATSNIPYGKVLRYGHRGNSVKSLQKDLNKHGYKVSVDGVFGKGLKSAVIRFQKANKLKADGYVGAATQLKLRNSKTTKISNSKKNSSPTASKLPYGKVLQYGHYGSDVKSLQRDLNKHGYKVSVDGVFGKGVKSAVIKFQKANKLKVDGKVTSATQARLAKKKTSKPTSSKTDYVKLTYIKGVVIANKKHPLPSNYAPGESKEARQAFNKMAASLKVKKKTKITTFSGYRSYRYQKDLFERYAKKHGLLKQIDGVPNRDTLNTKLALCLM